MASPEAVDLSPALHPAGTLLNGSKPGGSGFSYGNDHIALVNRFIDEPRALRVAVIGGGLAGILAGILLPAKVPGIQLQIFEKNQDFVRV